MTRREFTSRLALLILYARDCGYEPFIDYLKRSEEEQQRLFNRGLSKCDGREKVSKHQLGRAADIYLWDSERKRIIEEDGRAMYERLHAFWEILGGRPMIEWDMGHFEG